MVKGNFTARDLHGGRMKDFVFRKPVNEDRRKRRDCRYSGSFGNDKILGTLIDAGDPATGAQTDDGARLVASLGVGVRYLRHSGEDQKK